jgi:hypothetical protein
MDKIRKECLELSYLEQGLREMAIYSEPETFK